MANINSAYTYYMDTYASREASRYDTHKQSDLRKQYSKMIKKNTETPLYKIRDINSAVRFAIDIKEHAKAVQNVVAQLSDREEGFSDSFQRKVAVSSDDELVSVLYVGDGHEQNNTDQFQMVIYQLADPQVNIGSYLDDQACSFAPGTYCFDLNTQLSSYEIQYGVSEGETNIEIIDKLARLVNTSNLGIKADILSGQEGRSALSLTSVRTGLNSNESQLFSIVPAPTEGSLSTMDLLGIHHVFQPASNSKFLLNGKEHTSSSNTFTINNTIEVTLKKVHPPGEHTSIGFKANVDAITDNVTQLVTAYNRMILNAKEHMESSHQNNGRLFRDLRSASADRQVSLNEIGLSVENDGSVSVDRDQLCASLNPEDEQNTINTLNLFKDIIGEKADAASIDPMDYVDRVIVAYKNPGHNFITPYITSHYSGLMVDRSV